jgi:hypothetical protein
MSYRNANKKKILSALFTGKISLIEKVSKVEEMKSDAFIFV